MSHLCGTRHTVRYISGNTQKKKKRHTTCVSYFMSLPPNVQVSTNNLVSFVFFADRDTNYNTFVERDIQYTSLLNSVSLSAKRAKFLHIIQFPQMRKHSRSTNTKHTIQYICGKKHRICLYCILGLFLQNAQVITTTSVSTNAQVIPSTWDICTAQATHACLHMHD